MRRLDDTLVQGLSAVQWSNLRKIEISNFVLFSKLHYTLTAIPNISILLDKTK